jgi:hypothetical protein
VSALAISITPLNNHELAIALTVDRISAEGMLCLTSIPEIGAALDFMMYRSDSEFLVNYIRWRMDNPVAN